MSRGSGAKTVRAALALALLAGLGGCGGGEEKQAAPDRLTVYAAGPLSGPQAAVGRDMLDGERLALRERGRLVGEFLVELEAVDDAAPDGDEPSDGWDPGTSATAARTAAQDESSIAYIGHLDAGATAVALPILNAVGILQVSPATTYPGLTRPTSGAKGEPERYYPSGRRTFARIVPTDVVQARAQVELQRSERCREVLVVRSVQPFDAPLADLVTVGLRRHGVRTSDGGVLKGTPAELAERLRDVPGAPGCAFLADTDPASAAASMQALGARFRGARLFGPAALASPVFAGALGPVAADVRLTVPASGLGSGAAAASEFARSFRRAHGRAPGPWAVYGYEAMRAVLDAVARAGEDGNSRSKTLEAFFAAGPRRSALGRFAIDDRGDTDLDVFALGRVAGGRVVAGRRLPRE